MNIEITILEHNKSYVYSKINEGNDVNRSMNQEKIMKIKCRK